jgi:hypothetical protein
MGSSHTEECAHEGPPPLTLAEGHTHALGWSVVLPPCGRWWRADRRWWAQRAAVGAAPARRRVVRARRRGHAIRVGGPSSCRPAGDGGARAVGDGHAVQLEARLLRVGESFEHLAEAEPCAAPRRRPAALRAMAKSEPKPPGEAPPFEAKPQRDFWLSETIASRATEAVVERHDDAMKGANRTAAPKVRARSRSLSSMGARRSRRAGEAVSLTRSRAEPAKPCR